MILTCPDCSTRYSVKPSAIGHNGRTVRCSSCSGTWFVSSDPDVLSLTENEEEAIRQIDGGPIENEKPSQSAEPSFGADAHMRDKVERERRNRRLKSVFMIWGVTLGLLALAAVLVFGLRQNIVDRFPATASIYQAFNISVKESGLDFESPTTRHILIDGQPMLVVNGVIVNRSSRARDLPLIELSLVNGSGETLTQWLVEPEKTQLEAKERLEYVSQFPNPPLDAEDLKYRFMDVITPQE